MTQGDCSFLRDARVLITGHTGFKGGWLSLMLHDAGAQVFGVALGAEQPSFFSVCTLNALMTESHLIDIRDFDRFQRIATAIAPDVVIHLAAQSLVRTAIKDPVGTFATNVIGTAHVLESTRGCPGLKAALIITSDKCYAPNPNRTPFSERSPLGGEEPYAASKAAAELVVSGYRDAGLIGFPLASVRAGNVIGGGDWAAGRLIPDCIRALCNGARPMVRNPHHVRPWQHVLEPLSGYLLLLERLLNAGTEFNGAWNFGPNPGEEATVESVVGLVCEGWGGTISPQFATTPNLDENPWLVIDSTKAKHLLQWSPQWDLRTSIRQTVDWYRAWSRHEDMLRFTREQLATYRGLHRPVLIA
jgi:CDP-glucose 4,6-dehydratase